MRLFRFAVSVYHINNSNYIPSPVPALPSAAVVAADYIIIAVKADDSVEHIFLPDAVKHNIISRRGIRRANKAHRISALL